MHRSAEIWKQIDKLTEESKTWADFMNGLFARETGILFTAITDDDERTRFVQSERFKNVRDSFEKIVEKYGWVDGATPAASGRFVVRVPKSLHQALRSEALKEGVSLNQYIVFKLAAQLNFSATGKA